MRANRIDHVAVARELIADTAFEVNSDDEMALDVPVAQVHATLALVEQQRIANLIALLLGGDYTAWVIKGDRNMYNPEDWENVRSGIREGLGL
jgi:hypothetical protein